MKEPQRRKRIAARGVRKVASASLAMALAAGMCVPMAASAYADDESPLAAEAAADAAPDFPGADVVLRYMDGATPTLDELDQVDFTALRAWDASLADELLALQESLAAAAAGPSAPDPEPEAGAGSAEDEGASAGSGPEANAPEAEPAAPAVVPDEVPAGDPFDATQSYPEWSYSGDTSFTMIHYTEDMDAQKLVAAIGEPARQAAQEQGVSASEMIGLAVVTSNSGRNVAAQAPFRNLFRTVDEAGELVEYATYGDCLAHHAALVASGEAEALPDDGTWGGVDGSLAERVQAVIEDYDLTRYDEPLAYTPAEALTVPVWDEAAEAYVDAPVTLADLVDEALSHLGVPYVWGGTTPDGFDCSGLVQYAYANALNVSIPRTTYYQCLVGEDVDFADLHTGDLLFFVKDGVAGHVAMYLGEGCYIEAPQPGQEVKITAMDEKMPAFAKRVVSTVAVSEEEQAEAAADAAAAAAEQAQVAARQAERDVAAATYAAWRSMLS